MHGATIRFIFNAQQAKLNNNYKNTRLKLLKTKATIWFNRMCKPKQLKPKYINIRINGQKTQGDCNQRQQVQNRPRNQILISQETTPQSTTIPPTSGKCTSIYRYVAAYTRIHRQTNK